MGCWSIRLSRKPLRAAEIERARSLPSIRVDLEAIITIEMITTGVLSPNRGFMNEQDYLSVLEQGRLCDGTVWPVPLSFAPTGTMNQEVIAGLSNGDQVALVDDANDPVAILEIEDIFAYDREHRAEHLLGTTRPGACRASIPIYRRMGIPPWAARYTYAGSGGLGTALSTSPVRSPKTPGRASSMKKNSSTRLPVSLPVPTRCTAGMSTFTATP